MKKYLFALFFISISIFFACTDEEDLSVIDACDYILPPVNTTQSFSNEFISFDINIGLDTVPGNSSFLNAHRRGFLNETDIKIDFGCGANGSDVILGNFDELTYDLFEENEEAIEESDFVVDGVIDHRAFLYAASEILLDPETHPLLVTFGLAFQNATEASMGAAEPQTVTAYSRVSADSSNWEFVNRAFLRTTSTLVEHLDERTVNGTIYEDVIRVEVEFRIELYPDFQNGDDSPVRVYDCEYWFAKGIGMIETSDRNFKRTN